MATTTKKLRILICYPLINGYMAACWRELSERTGIEIKLIGHLPGRDDMVAFTGSLVEGISSYLMRDDEKGDVALTARIAAEFEPDMMLISGWSHPPFRNLYRDPRFKDVKKVLLMDNQLRRDWRQWAGKYLLRPIIKNVDCFFVTGERAFQLARYWGVPESRIRTGCVSVDYRTLQPSHARRLEEAASWPKAFLFAGRYHERKAIGVMVAAYKAYRDTVDDPWPLLTVGMGPEDHHFKDVPGIENLGFVHPNDMPQVWARAGAFVLASRYDAWPLVNIEAAASGLPVLCTRACGSQVETIRHMYSGFVVPTEDVTAFAQGLGWLHQNHANLPEFGMRAQAQAQAFSAQAWADRVQEIAVSIDLMPASELVL